MASKQAFQYVEFTKPWIHSHQLEGCRIGDPKADVTFSDGKKVYSAGKYATDNYACDLRVIATGEVLHHANWSEKRGASPSVPQTAMFVAQACEKQLAAQARKK